MPSVVGRLPPELLVECFLAADPPTRVRSSHVSCSWRNVALACRRLWDSFSCAFFNHPRHQDAMFEMLQTMLRRSGSLPFRLCIPHRYRIGSRSDYVDRVLALDGLDARRLALYDGPSFIFASLNVDHSPLPQLASLNILEPEETASEFFFTDTGMLGTFSARCLPNLHTLQADKLRFSPQSDTFQSLQHLTCSVSEPGYEQLFACCPNLVHLQLNDLDCDYALPAVSLPVSLRTVVLCPMRHWGLELLLVLHNWARERLPRLVMHGVLSLQGVLPLFLVSHSHPVELRLNSRRNEIELITLPPHGATALSWTITPSRKCTSSFLAGLDTRGSDRLTSISVAMEQLVRLFAAQLSMAGLERLEFRLGGTLERRPLQASDEFYIHAPRLHSVAFLADDSANTHLDNIKRVLGVLRASFCALIRYDADLLESITLSAPASAIQYMDCAGLARFAKEYVVCETT